MSHFIISACTRVCLCRKNVAYKQMMKKKRWRFFFQIDPKWNSISTFSKIVHENRSRYGTMHQPFSIYLRCRQSGTAWLNRFSMARFNKKKPKSNIEITLRILFEYAMHRTWAASSDIEISSIAKFSNQFIHVLITLRQIDVVVLETNLMGSFFFAVLVRFKCFSKPTICQQVSRFHIFASIDLSIARDYFVVI